MKPIVLLCLAFALTVGSAAVRAQDCPDPLPGGGAVKGKISRNYYRIPYADGTTVTMGASADYFGHGGSMDTFSDPSGGVLVAPADGVICFVRDDLNDCGCTLESSNPIGGCGNRLAIVHDNGEMSDYLHLQQFSIRNTFGVTDPEDLIGVFVQKGQAVGLEGDVGRTCGSTSAPRWGTCISQQQAQGLGNCGSHVHWNIRRLTTGELLQPMTCNLLSGIYATNLDYTANACPPIGLCNLLAPGLCCASPQAYDGVVLDGYGNSRVYQNAVSVTATNFEVRNLAAAVFHAGGNVRLLPGFKAGSGNAYFRAEIAPCNQTAPNP